MAILSLDLGKKRTGLALNPYGGIILELKTIEHKSPEELFSRLSLIINDYGVDKIILGKIRSENKDLLEIKAGIQSVFSGLEIIEVDETLSTKEAERQLAEEGDSGDSDARAAKIILEQYLREKS